MEGYYETPYFTRLLKRESSIYHNQKSFQLMIQKSGDQSYHTSLWGMMHSVLPDTLIKPYPNRGQTEEQQIFNYRLSRARRVSENAFGLLASRFRVFHSMFNVRPESVISIVHATLVLHNFLLKQCPRYMTSVDDAVDELHLPSNLENLTIRGCNHPKHATEIRDTLSEYLNGPGMVLWQWKLLLP